MVIEKYIHFAKGNRNMGPNIRFVKKKPAGAYGDICIGFSVNKYGYDEALRKAVEAKTDYLAKFDN